MADNVTLDPGSGGSVMATDEDGSSVHWPYCKIVFGPADTQTIVTATTGLPIQDDGGAITVDWNGTAPPIGSGLEATALRVTLATDSTGVLSVDDNSGSLTVDNGGTFVVQEDGASLTALQLIDDIVYVDDTATHATGTSKGALLMAAATPTDGSVDANDIGAIAMSTDRRMHVDAQIVGTDAALDVSGANVTVVGTGTFVVQIDGDALTALQLIDDVVYTDDTSTHATGTSKGVGLMAAATPTDGSVDANDIGMLAMSTDRRLLVDAQIAGQDADVNIADGGNAITVDWNGTAPPIGAGTEAAALRVTLATDSTGVITVDNAGTFATQVDGDALTALQLIDDIVHVDDTATHATGTSKGALLMAAATPTDGSVDANDIGAVAMSTDRRLHVDADITAAVALDVSAATVTVDLGANNDVQGQVAHDAANSGNPVVIGAEAIAHGTNPTAVAAADATKLYANRAGVPFVIGGHPNVVTETVTVADADGAQTDTAIHTVGAGTKIVVTRLSVTCSNANTVDVSVKVGFGTATLGTPGTAGTTGILHEFKAIPAGGGVTIGDGSGILGVGADNEDLRYTCDDPVSGHVSISVSYYTIES